MNNYYITSLWEIFEETVKQNGSKIAIINKNFFYTYNEYYENVCSLTHYLSENKQLLSKDKILIYAENSFLFACYIMACIKLNITLIPLNNKLSKEDFTKIYSDTNPSIVFTDQNWVIEEGIGEALTLPKYAYHKNYCNSINNNKDNDVVFILFSSGSTGEIKGIECTESAIIASTFAINEIIGNTVDDNILCILDFSFDYGLYQLILAFEVGAAVTILTSNDNILRIPDYIKKYEVTGFPATPFLLKTLFETKRASHDKLKNLRYISSTGDHLSSTLIDLYINLLPNTNLFPMYGLTECKRVSILKPEEYATHKNSVGKTISCCEARVVDCLGNEVPRGTEGELVITGSNIMKGYYNDPELTNEKFSINDLGEIELHTGDIFSMDNEGYLYFKNRTQNFIKLREKRVSPLSIENDILNRVDGIIECLIVPIHDYLNPDKICCFLRLDKDYSIETIIKEIHNKLSKKYFPDYFCNYNEMFLYNKNGKIDRRAMEKVAQKKHEECSLIKGIL